PNRPTPVESVAFSGDGRLVAAARGQGTVYLLSADGSGASTTLPGHGAAVHAVDVSPDGSQIATVDEAGNIGLSTLDGGTARVLATADLPERDVAFSPDGTRIMAVGDD